MTKGIIEDFVICCIILGVSYSIGGFNLALCFSILCSVFMLADAIGAFTELKYTEATNAKEKHDESDDKYDNESDDE